jgi:hypothetical protein
MDLKIRIVFLFLFFYAKVFSLEQDSFTLESPKSNNLHVYIHVCTITRWEEILSRQLDLMNECGLYDQAKTINLGILGTGSIEKFKKKFPKIEVVFQSEDLTLYERPTLLKMHQKALESENDALFLYLHSKGVTKTDKEWVFVKDWSQYMEYFLIEKWKSCVKELIDNSKDACGINWFGANSQRPQHFSGNFWWAKGEYLKSLPHYIGDGYFDPEFWIGLNSPNVKCFFFSRINHYKKPFPRIKYAKKNFK